MSDEMFEFDIDAQLAEAEAKALRKVNAQPVELEEDEDCEGCKI